MDCLFEVWKKNNEYLTRAKVFGVRDDKVGYPHFLVYEDGEWKYEKAKHFIPMNVTIET